MKYDFNTLVDRRNSSSVKWDERKEDGLIPMWVADMDFKAAPFIIEKLQKRIDHGVFGYVHIPEEYYESAISWFAKRRNWTIKRDWIQPIAGLVPALSVAVKAFCQPGDAVVFLNPAYNCFFSSVRNNGCMALASDLICTENEDGTLDFRMDFDDIEKKCAESRAKLFILCNPHNPTGRIWSREELLRLGEICRRNNVIVVSDEIHCELEMPGCTYVPFASTCPENQDNCVSFNSPSKSFNLAGLMISNIVTSRPEWRERIDRVINDWEHCDVNPFGVDALIASYTKEGEEWLSELNDVLWGNYVHLRNELKKALPELHICNLEGTYLPWLNVAPFVEKGITAKAISESLIQNEKVWINGGEMYGDGKYMRINIACPRERLVEGTRRIVAGLLRLKSEYGI